jgi:NADH-quinone oxidoreductase subunit N
LTAGFLGKFYILAAGASSSIWTLIIILVVSSAIGLYYYLRIVIVVFSNLPLGGEEMRLTLSPLSLLGCYTLVVLAILLIWFGVYPSQLLNLIRSAGFG